MFCPMSMFCMAVTIKCSVPSLCYAWLTRLLPYIGLSHVCVKIQCSFPSLCNAWLTWLLQCSGLSHVCDCYNSVLSHVCVLYGCYNTVFCPMSVYCMAVTIQCSVPSLWYAWLIWLLQYSGLSHVCVLCGWRCPNNAVFCPMLVFCLTDMAVTMFCPMFQGVNYSYSAHQGQLQLHSHHHFLCVVLHHARSYRVSIYFWVVWAETCFPCWHRAMIHEYSFCLFLQRTKFSFWQKRRHSCITVHFHQWNARGERYCFQKNCNVFLIFL